MSDPKTPNPDPANPSEKTHAVLVAGFWLGGWAWGDIEPPLRAAGIIPHALTLPGLDGAGTKGVTLVDQIDAVSKVIDRLEGDVVLVGHSGGAAVVQGVIDHNPRRIRRVVYVDSGPLLDGVVLMPDAADDVALPSWDELAAQNSSIEGIDDAGLALFRQQAVDEPVGVAGAPIRLTNAERFDIPASVICTSIESGLLQQLIESGNIPSELGSVHDVTYVDLPTGHWPMFSRPADLAAAIQAEIRR